MSTKQEQRNVSEQLGEPVGEARLMQEGFTHCIWSESVVPVGTKFYTTPPQGEARGLSQQPAQKPWVGLTDEEKADISAQGHQRWKEYAEAVEAKLKEKNT